MPFVVPAGFRTGFATIRRGVVSSREADGIFRWVMREGGVRVLRRWLMWAGGATLRRRVSPRAAG